MTPPTPGRVVILNGAPRAGKSSIARVIQATFPGVWMNLGNDVFIRGVTPERVRPGVGLRPGPGPGTGGERPDVEELLPALFGAMYESIAAHARLGLDVVADVGHHGAHHPGLLNACARRLAELPVLFVGVRCPIEEVLRRRGASAEGRYVRATPEDPVPAPVRLWQEAVHEPGVYDVEVDTSQLSPEACAEVIARRLERGPPGDAFARLAAAG